jgi:iron(III) transport system ATP-binding protein
MTVSDLAASSRPRLQVERLTLRYGRLIALEDVSIDVRPGEVLCLLGPSGSGKSSLLRVIAGLERPSGGRVLIDGREVAGPRAFVEPERRAIGMVFQDFALFPHLTVAANVGFGLRGLPRDEAARRTAAMLARVDLSRYADSYPHLLSGGERQRVALARALAPEPRILLMDEPFSSLDGRLRDRVRRETMDLLRETHTTTLVVTHDPDEAMRIADRIALFGEGRLVQVGSPQEIYTRPASLFAARFFTEINELPAVRVNGRVETPLGVFRAPAGCADTPRVCVRPEHLRIAHGPTGIRARVMRSEFCGDSEQLLLMVPGVPAPLTARARGRTGLAPGDAVDLEISEDQVLVLAG